MNAANRSRNIDLNVNRSSRVSQRSRRTPIFIYNRIRGSFVRNTYHENSARVRRARRIPFRMNGDDSSSEGSQPALPTEPEDLEPANTGVDDMRPSCSNSASTSAQGMAALRVVVNTSEPTTSRNAIREPLPPAGLAAPASNAVTPPVGAEIIDISSPERNERSRNATVVSDAIAVSNAALESPSSEGTAAAAAAPSNAEVNTTPLPKKRKRTSNDTPKVKGTPRVDGTAWNSDEEDTDEDNGCTCPICFDNWEMSGEHRLVALRCGHLFGESCIRRWLAECGRQSGVKMCPQCKTKATPRDIRYLYAKRVRAIDRTEEHELRKSLDRNRKKLKNVEIELDTLKITYAVTLKKVHERDMEIQRLKNAYPMCSNRSFLEEADSAPSSKIYKLFMEKNILLSRDSGSRVMAYSARASTLLVSQKNSNGLFPGFGVRLIEVPTFRAMHFMHLTNKMLRDISISADQNIMACTSLEPSVKLYDFRVRTAVAIAAPNSDKNLWACAMGDETRENYLYAGGQQGGTFVFDTRHPNNVLAEYETIGDLSPVVSIVVIPKNDDFPLGGFCICKLMSIWFYEYQENGVVPTRLNVEGPFMSINYVESEALLIVSARSNAPDLTESRYIVGKLQKVQQRPHFELTATLMGSKTTPLMTRCCHISIDSKTLLATYIQDSRQLAVFDIHRKLRTQSLPIYDIVYDTCPIYTSTDVFVAALTETKCRVYKVTEY